MKRPICELPLLNIVEMTKRTIISRKFILATMAPMIVSQFFVDLGSFILVRFSVRTGVKIEKYCLIPPTSVMK